MKYLNKISSVFCTTALGLLVLTGCEGADLYNLTAPDWISDKVDSIAASKDTGDEVLVGMNEDVYTIGATDFSTGWWTAWSKYYVIPEGGRWDAVFNLNINPSASNTYKNFALIICSDADRGGDGYLEYGAIRYDNQPSGNSEWGDYIDRSFIESNLTFATDTDEGVDKLGGRVTLTVDRSRVDTFYVRITNGSVTKTYTQPSALVNLNADASNTNIRCFLAVEGSYINFQESNVEPIGGYTSAADKQPLSMVLENVPDEVIRGTSLEEAMSGVSATVTFEQGVTAVVPASELYFSSIPDMDEPGEKTLVVVYNKTFKGEGASQPVVAYAKFNVVNPIESIAITQSPARSHYYFYTSPATANMENRTLAFDPTGMEVTATYTDGTTGIVDNSKLTFSPVPATAGNHTVTITTANGKTVETSVTVSESTATAGAFNAGMVGPEDNVTEWWTYFSNDVKVPAGETVYATFTNYSNLVANWNNFLVILRNSSMVEHAVVRADNYGWGAGYEGQPVVLSGGQADWDYWLSVMNGAKVTVYVTNCNNGTADVQAIMTGTDGNTYTQYYLGITTVDPNDLNMAFTVDGCHLVFE